MCPALSFALCFLGFFGPTVYTQGSNPPLPLLFNTLFCLLIKKINFYLHGAVLNMIYQKSYSFKLRIVACYYALVPHVVLILLHFHSLSISFKYYIVIM